ncbi:MAG: TetR/AcrR family transcriptional regulator [Bacteroidetes bacterium]|nr:TetR/AcrR family transcriptional regulator [Bacteroidota bacterium]MCB0844239.1 TetR/AcrR family transcriptional regulator [Bacteroidota bacterium]MCB0853810.1 TetR/AcrR family transcriptional regulator [Bacteroidota bacterium]
MSPRTKKQLADHRESRREEILNAALELFAKNGYHNTSVEQIRKKAGVSKGLIYNYFKEKKDLMKAIVMGSMEQAGQFFETMEELTNPREKLKLLIDLSFDYITKQFEHSKLMVGLSLQVDQFDELDQIVHGKYAGTMPLLENLLKEIGFPNPKEEAYLLAALMDGIGIQYIVLKDDLPVETLRNYLYQKYSLI